MNKKIFPGVYKALAEIGEFVSSQSEKAGLNENDVYSVQLAVDEACTNIIEHGYEGEGIGEIECTCEILPDGIMITLIDEGKLFNPKDAPIPKLQIPLDELVSRGAGVYLMHKVMDEVTYSVSKDNKNKLKLFKKNS
jgi:serine/threonine-protein kinase RsbW